ncbi:hypothetical protein [Acidovorax sp. BL-A-41-H1]|uniref:hypothetical protein n=1 Tax=Acidovorax sp. BL-A-41-H1 TaxID=3421102 RepID=UPI003F78FC19
MADKHNTSDKDDGQNNDQGSGKVANDRNSAGKQPTTQLHQDQRTPHSRHDRESQVGSGNQSQSRKGGAGSGGGAGGAGGRGAG